MNRSRIARLCLFGTFSLLACDSNIPGITPPTGNDGRVKTLAVTPTGSFLQVGQQRALAVEARDSSGTLVSNITLTWQSDAPTVASVSASGTVSALSPGVARITATSGGISTVIDVGVTAVAPGVAQWTLTRAGFTDATFLGVWDDAAGTTWAVGQRGVIVRSVNGGAWQVVPSGVTISLLGIWGSSPTDIWTVGENGTILRYNGSTFQSVSGSPNITLLEVWGLSVNEVYALGDQGVLSCLVQAGDIGAEFVEIGCKVGEFVACALFAANEVYEDILLGACRGVVGIKPLVHQYRERSLNGNCRLSKGVTDEACCQERLRM